MTIKNRGKKMIHNLTDDGKCAECGSTNITQTATHSSHGYNGFRCKCGFEWGN